MSAFCFVYKFVGDAVFERYRYDAAVRYQNTVDYRADIFLQDVRGRIHGKVFVINVFPVLKP